MLTRQQDFYLRQMDAGFRLTHDAQNVVKYLGQLSGGIHGCGVALA
jgi:hypothetical protein